MELGVSISWRGNVWHRFYLVNWISICVSWNTLQRLLIMELANNHFMFKIVWRQELFGMPYFWRLARRHWIRDGCWQKKVANAGQLLVSKLVPLHSSLSQCGRPAVSRLLDPCPFIVQRTHCPAHPNISIDSNFYKMKGERTSSQANKQSHWPIYQHHLPGICIWWRKLSKKKKTDMDLN